MFIERESKKFLLAPAERNELVRTIAGNIALRWSAVVLITVSINIWLRWSQSDSYASR